jgi:hypothetical protein
MTDGRLRNRLGSAADQQPTTITAKSLFLQVEPGYHVTLSMPHQNVVFVMQFDAVIGEI